MNRNTILAEYRFDNILFHTESLQTASVGINELNGPEIILIYVIVTRFCYYA